MSDRGTQGKRGRKAGGARLVELSVAAEMVARTFEVEASRLLQAWLLAPLSFFSGARQDGVGSWRVPMAEVEAMMLCSQDRAVSAVTLAQMLGVSRRSVELAMKQGRIPCVDLKVIGIDLKRVPLLQVWELLRESQRPLGVAPGAAGRGLGLRRSRRALGGATTSGAPFSFFSGSEMGSQQEGRLG